MIGFRELLTFPNPIEIADLSGRSCVMSCSYNSDGQFDSRREPTVLFFSWIDMEVGAQRYKSSGEAGVQEIFTFHQSARRCEFRLSAGRMRGKAGKYVFEEAGALGGPETHVLAVDDCLIDRKIIERLLKTDSVKVTMVDSATRALEILGVSQEQTTTPACQNAFKFSMVITDYCMPGMTGYDLLKKLKETKGLKEIPVVIMSSENVPQRIQRCLDEGALDFIIKPLKLEDVKKLRRNIMQMQSMRAAAITTVTTKMEVSSVRLVGEASDGRTRPRIREVTVPWFRPVARFYVACYFHWQFFNARKRNDKWAVEQLLSCPAKLGFSFIMSEICSCIVCFTLASAFSWNRGNPLVSGSSNQRKC